MALSRSFGFPCQYVNEKEIKHTGSSVEPNLNGFVAALCDVCQWNMPGVTLKKEALGQNLLWNQRPLDSV